MQTLSQEVVQQYGSWPQTALAQALQVLDSALPVEQTGCAQLPPPATQTLFEQTWPAPHVPHCSVPPQPFERVPQVLPCAAQVVGVQEPPHVEPHQDLASLTQTESHDVAQQYPSLPQTVVAQELQPLVSFTPELHSL